MLLAFRPLGNLTGITETMLGRATDKYCDCFVPRNDINTLLTRPRLFVKWLPQ